MVRNFLWDDKKPKIAYKRLISSKERGGQSLQDLMFIDKSIKIEIFAKIIREKNFSPFWLNFLFDMFPIDRNHLALLNFSTKDVRLLMKDSLFKDICAEWAQMNFSSPSSANDILQQFLWFNSHIKSNKSWMFHENLYNVGVRKVIDLFNLDTGSFMSFDEFIEMFPSVQINFLEYYKIVAAIP